MSDKRFCFCAHLGVVFIDEIDKVASRPEFRYGWYGLGFC